MTALWALLRALVDAWRSSGWDRPAVFPLIPEHTIVDGRWRDGHV
jgi:hypothetical protein